jgi:hypothetical protein
MGARSGEALKPATSFMKCEVGHCANQPDILRNVLEKENSTCRKL